MLLLLLKLPFGTGDLPTLIPELEWILTGQKMASGSAIYREIWTSTSPIVALIYDTILVVFSNSALYFELFALVLVFIQAILFNFICQSRKLFLEKSFIPAAVYVIVMSVSFDLQKLTPALIGVTFILLSLDSILRQIQSSQVNTNHSFEIGFFIGLGSLTHFPISILVVWAVFALVLYSNLNLRQFLLLLLGFALPFLAYIIYYSFVGSIQEFRDQWLESIFRIKAFSFGNFYNSLFVYAFPFLFMVLGILRIFSVSRYNSYQNRAHHIVLILGILSLFTVILADNTATYQFAVLAPVIAFFAAGFFVHLKGTYLPEVLFITFLFAVCLIQLIGVSNILGINYKHLSSLRVDEEIAKKFEGKKLLITGYDNSAYKNATSATKYLNWSLSRFEIENPDNYQSVISINETFDADKPEIIIDNAAVFPVVFEILPALKSQYKQTEKNIYQLKK